MSKRPTRQLSMSNFLQPKGSKISNNSSDQIHEHVSLCPKCQIDCSGSVHHCFCCNKPGHPFCSYLETSLEAYGAPILCKSCYTKTPYLFIKI